MCTDMYMQQDFFSHEEQGKKKEYNNSNSNPK